MKTQLIKLSLVAGLLALFIPTVASAQGWPDYRRDRDNGRYDSRYLRESIHRLDRLAKDFERDIDRTLDRSRANGTRREDRLNGEARQFRNAVGNLKSSFGNGRDLRGSRDEAQRVLNEASQLDRVMGRMNTQAGYRWTEIRRELNVISNAYGLGYYGSNGRQDNRNNAPWWERIIRP